MAYASLQIVIAGASECGLAVLERLLLDPDLQFNYLTLLAPGGIKVGQLETAETWLENEGIREGIAATSAIISEAVRHSGHRWNARG